MDFGSGTNLIPLTPYIPNITPEVGIYRRKQESKKTRKQELDQESDQEKRKKKKENTLSTKKAPKITIKKKRKIFLFSLVAFLVESVFSCFLL